MLELLQLLWLILLYLRGLLEELVVVMPWFELRKRIAPRRHRNPLRVRLRRWIKLGLVGGHGQADDDIDVDGYREGVLQVALCPERLFKKRREGRHVFDGPHEQVAVDICLAKFMGQIVPRRMIPGRI